MIGQIGKVRLEAGAFRRRALGTLAVLALLFFAAGCYFPGFGSSASDPPGPTPPGGFSETMVGKFVLYESAGGKIKSLQNLQDPKIGPAEKFDYIVGETYFPGSDWTVGKDFNIMHQGDGTYSAPYNLIYGNTVVGEYFLYKDMNDDQRNASSYPEGLILEGQLALYFSNWYGYTFFQSETTFNCDPPDDIGEAVPPVPGTEQMLLLNSYWFSAFHSLPGAPDSDVYTIHVDQPGTMVVFKVLFQALMGQHNAADVNLGADAFDLRHKPKLTLYDEAGVPLLWPNGQTVQATTAIDYWKWQDAEIAYNFQDGGTYHLKVEDLGKYPCLAGADDNEHTYWLLIESPNADKDRNAIIKGEIQPARSGSPVLDGGRSFEPDDLTTVVEDVLPDCDGVPGSGDEGDWGIFEQCNNYKDLGAQDGVMQYQEVDDKSAIDDGEFFVGVPTNVGTTNQSEPSIIKNPTGNSLLMFINYGSRIYMLESLDGQDGKQWDLTNLEQDRPAVVPRMQRDGGDPKGPVVSSGPLGYCETQPAAGDVYAFPELADAATASGVTPTATGAVINRPVGYPDQVAVSFGGNHILDGEALVDDQEGDTIYSGVDGIVNTLFAPKAEAYRTRPSWYVSMSIFAKPISGPYPDQGFNGPGNPPNPAIWTDDEAGGFASPRYMFPLGGSTGGSDQSGYLLGDDEWNPAIFFGDTLTPPAYMFKQTCPFYSLSNSFDQCAMGSPSDENGNVPIAIESKTNRPLNTVDWVLNKFRGDDALCHYGDSVAICPGRDGKFGWKDMYLPIQGDDELVVAFDPPHLLTDYSMPGIWWPSIVFLNGPMPFAGGTEIGIGPGPDGVLQTEIIDSYTIFDLINWNAYLGGDHYCQTLDGRTAICPGVEVKINLYDLGTVNPLAMVPRESKKLMSVWPMYASNGVSGMIRETILPMPVTFLGGPVLDNVFPGKFDLYGIYDDQFCAVDGEVAICPGEDGYFQGYPLFQKLIVTKDDDLFNLYHRISYLIDRPCYTMVSEIYQDHPTQETKTRYVLYHYTGVLFDDRIGYDQASRRYYVNVGANGINQSCIGPGDLELIQHHRGYADMPIITPGPDGVLQTYALQDEVVQWGPNVKKISTGPDGIANSFANGDDRDETMFGTGRPDMPCVLAGPDGVANTTAQKYANDNTAPLRANDSQLFRPGEITGFDAYQVWGVDATSYGDQIFLYYSALGWQVLPELFQQGAGGLADLGECKHAGLDNEWGEKDPLDLGFSTTEIELYQFWRSFDNIEFRQYLDNNNGVLLAPRIGVVTSTFARLKKDPTDWTYHDEPALDVGRRCAGTMSFPIDLPLDLPGLMPDINFSGAFSPEIEITDAETGDAPLFLLFYTGLNKGQNDNDIVVNNYSIGLARSLDGLKFEQLRDADPLIASGTFNLLDILGSDTDYGWPTIVNAGEDEYGEPMFGMFLNEFESAIGGRKGYIRKNFDLRNIDWITYALRKGKFVGGCSIGSPRLSPESRAQDAVSLALLLLPLAVFIAVRSFRRETD